MHTIKVLAAGFALLALFLFVGHRLGGTPRAGLAGAAKAFIPVWLVAAGINTWIGVARAGYSVRDEAPIFLLVFSIPAAGAGLIWWRSSGP